MADEAGGVADLRPAASGEGSDLGRLMRGRVAKLERLGLAEQIAPGCWSLRSNAEQTLRDLSIRGDIIKTMHRAMSTTGRAADVAAFTLHGDNPADRVLGRLAARGLYDELKGTAYAIVEGVDGRTHHLTFTDLEMTGDAKAGAIVEARSYDDATGRKRLSLNHPFRPFPAGTDRSGRRHLDRSPASRARNRSQQRRIWHGRARGDGSARGASGWRGACPQTRAARHLRARSSFNTAKTGAEQRSGKDRR